MLVGSAIGLFACGGIQFILFVFGGVDNVSPAMLLALVPLLFYILASISVLLRRKWATVAACIAGLIGVVTSVLRLRSMGIGQPQLMYFLNHLIYLSWFSYVLVINKNEVAQQRH